MAYAPCGLRLTLKTSDRPCVQVMSKYQFCPFCVRSMFYHCSVVVCGRKIAIGDVPPVAQLFPCCMGTAAPVGHSWFVKKICCAAADGARERERERQPARRICAEAARVAPARKVFSSLRKAPSSLVSSQDIAPSFSLATGGDSCEHRALAGRWRKR